jgi:hypothetical protein
VIVAGLAGGEGLALRGCRGAADAEFFLHEDLGEAEAAAGEFAGFVVWEEFDAFFADFGEEDLPGFVAEVVDGKEGAVLAFAAGLFGVAAALVFVAAEALLFAALLFGIAASLFLFAALLGGELLGLGVAGEARVAGVPRVAGVSGVSRVAGVPRVAGVSRVLAGRAGFALGAHAVAGEGLAGEGAIFLKWGGWAWFSLGFSFSFCLGFSLGFSLGSGGRGGGGGGSFLAAGQRRFGDVLHDFWGKLP